MRAAVARGAARAAAAQAAGLATAATATYAAAAWAAARPAAAERACDLRGNFSRGILETFSIKTALIDRALERFARPAGGFLELIAHFIRRVGHLIADRTEVLAFERGSRKCRSDSRTGGDARNRDRERLILQDAADGAFKCRLSLLRNTRRLFTNRAAGLTGIVRSRRRDRPDRIHGSVGDVAGIILRARQSLGKAAASALF